MSRIGNAIINLPKGVTVTLGTGNVVRVKGPKGELTQTMDPDISLEIEEGVLRVTRPTDQKRHKALHGLYRALISNMVTGVSSGFKKELELVGVGFRAAATGQILELQVGFSHPIFMALPKEIKLSSETVKGKNPTITLESNDRQLLGQVAAKIRSIRKPEPYKGKGIKYTDEVLRRKAGKTASSK
jgi:large subunit ribosomal protein L6